MKRLFGWLCVAVLAGSGCDRAGPQPVAEAVAPALGEDGPAPTELPTPPLNLPVPSPMAAVQGERDFSKMGRDELSLIAQDADEEGAFKVALIAQYWAVRKGDDGYYDLARYYARNSLTNAALYWLQQAALKTGADARQADEDEDLATVRQDPSYAAVAVFLRRCEAYWRTHGKSATLLYRPAGFNASKPTAIVVCLHGRGSRPDHFFGKTTQALADAIGIPIVSVSGTQPTGPKSFVWAVDAVKDQARLDAALKEISDRVTVAPGKIVAIGFSEGAQVAVELAARDPARYAGAIAISPGADFHLDKAQATPADRKSTRLNSSHG